MPVNIKNTKFARNLVTPKDFKGHNGGIAQHVTSNAAMKYLQRAVVACISEERIAAIWMEFHGANSLAVIPQGFIGPSRQIQIMPKKTTVVRTDDDVIST
jgi:hypothetical protein